MRTKAVVDSISVSELCDYFTYVSPSRLDIRKPCVVHHTGAVWISEQSAIMSLTALTGWAVVRRIAIGDY